MLTEAQKAALCRDGYLKVPQAVPPAMVASARAAIDDSLLRNGLHPAKPEQHRGAAYCVELSGAAVLCDLFNRTAVWHAAEALLGVGRIEPVTEIQIALVLPNGDKRAPLHGHLDGLGTGENGWPVGEYHRHFTAMTIVYLSDVPSPFSGNFTVWPESHRVYEDYFRRHGHEELAGGVPAIPLPHEPVQIVGSAGDAVIGHHQILHEAAPNTSGRVRYAVLARVRHVDCDANGADAYTDIWREWEGARDQAAALGARRRSLRDFLPWRVRAST